MSISKSSAGVSTQSQVTLAQNGSVAKSGQVATQGMLPGQEELHKIYHRDKV